MRPRVTLTAILTLALLLSSVIGLQAVRERHALPDIGSSVEGAEPYVQSAPFLKRAVLSYDALAADVYWMRVVQRYGSTKLSTEPNKRYDFLYPMLDLTTSLDPDFEVAYRFGAVFLAEEYPGGAGRPDLALKLLEKGLASHPSKWQYAQDIAFVHYWSRHDYVQAADWFKRAARMPLSPPWLAPMAAIMLTQGGDRSAARSLWQRVFNNTDADWLMEQARFRLTQLDAMDQIEALERLAKAYEQQNGRLPQTWEDMVRAGLLNGIPLDPRRFPYQLHPDSGTVSLATNSTLMPLPPTEQVRR